MSRYTDVLARLEKSADISHPELGEYYRADPALLADAARAIRNLESLVAELECAASLLRLQTPETQRALERIRAKLRYDRAVDDLHDHHDEIKDLRLQVRRLEDHNAALRLEVRTQRKEIAALREERKAFFDAERPWRNENPGAGWIT